MRYKYFRNLEQKLSFRLPEQHFLLFFLIFEHILTFILYLDFPDSYTCFLISPSNAMLLEKYWNDMETILFKHFSFLDLKVLDKREHLINNCIN